MTLRQQIVHDRVEQIEQALGINNDQAFLRFVHQLITGISLYSFDVGDLTEGGQDKQIDTITIDEESNRATVYIIQTKNTSGQCINSDEEWFKLVIQYASI